MRAKLAATLLLLLLLALPATAKESAAILGSDGTLFRLHNGLFGELFSDGTEANHNYQVLALEVVHPDGSAERLLVPGTDNVYEEVSESAVFEDTSGTLYLLWEGMVYGIHPKIFLVGYDGEQWGEVLEVGASPFGRKSFPQLVIAQDRYTREDSALSWSERTVLYVAWWEEKAYGSTKILAPVVIEDGYFVGRADVVDLPRLLTRDDDYPRVSDGVVNSLRLLPGASHRASVVGFLDPASGLLSVLQLEMLAPALVDLAEKARLQIINLGYKDDHDDLAAAVYAAMTDLESELHEANLQWLASHVRAMLAAAQDIELNSEGVTLLADKARLQIINLGAAFKDQGLEMTGSVGVLHVAGSDPDSLGHFLKVSLVQRLEAPEIEATAQLLLSETGDRVILAWPSSDEVAMEYLESRSDGSWSDVRSIPLVNGIDAAAALEILHQRLRKR